MVYEYMELGDLAQLLRSANEFIDGKPTNFLSEQVIGDDNNLFV